MKTVRIQERIRKAEQALARERGQAQQAKVQTAVSIGATVLGALFGRRSLGRATTASRGVGRSIEQAGDVGRATENLETLRREVAELGAELQAEIRNLEARIDPQTEPLTTVVFRPRKATSRCASWHSGGSPGGLRLGVTACPPAPTSPTEREPLSAIPRLVPPPSYSASSAEP